MKGSIIMKKISYLLLLVVLFNYGYSQSRIDDKLSPYISTLKEKGENPVQFILGSLDKNDLILFDDGLHTAVEPFQFYQKLIKNKEFQKKVKYIFLEVVSITQQPALDAYFNSKTDDLKLLYPAFQNDFSGTGWTYKTYFDLLETIWKVNSTLPVKDRFKVEAVNAPVYWNEIKTPEDLKLFGLGLSGNDYTMYKIMLSYLDNFKSGEKGIFLTNTRHAYKGIKNKDNQYYWDCGTFFHRFSPGKTYSVRFHNITLSFEGRRQIDSTTHVTTQGLEGVIVKWVRMEKGLWDSAFKEYGNRPVAFDLKNTPFGETKYIGNHMLNVAPGQTMYDAYDAFIFLASLEELHQTAMVDFIYTDKFKPELERRLNVLYTKGQLEELLKSNDSSSLRNFIDKNFVAEPEEIQPLVKKIGPIDAWKNNK